MATHRRVTGVWVAIAALALNGCSLVVGIPDREYRDGSADSAADGGNAIPEGGGDTSPGDVRVLDGPQDSIGEAMDSSMDSQDGDSTSEAGATFCQRVTATPALLLCDDFEQGSTSLSPWTLAGPTLDGIQFSPPPSPGHSLLADVPMANGSTASSASWGPSAGYANLELAFDLFIDGAPSDANTIVATMGVDSDVQLVLQAKFGAGAAEVYEVVNGTAGAPANLGTAVWTTQSWFRVDIKLHIVTGAASTLTSLTLQALPNGMPQVAISNFSLSTSWTTDAPVVTLESAPQSSTSQDDRLHFDNVEVFGSN